jgi:uncharacterized phiE125 gp8 family phage protein
MPSILLNGPAVEPLTLGEAKAFIRVAHDDDDDIIAALIAGARIHIEAQTRRALITQTWRIVRDAWPENGRLAPLPVPLATLVAARIYKASGATQTIDLAGFTLDSAAAPAMLSFTRGALMAPERRAAGIEIDITCGHGDTAEDVPEPLRQAVRLLVAHWYEHRGLVTLGTESAILPASVAALIGPYRVLSL